MEQHLHITNSNHFDLAATLFKAQSRCKGIIAINAGSCIKRQFYFKLAKFLATQNYDVLTYDYHGVGESRPKNLRGFKASITNWAKYDIKAVIEWMNKKYANQKKFIIAHSMGGQIMGLVENYSKIDKLVCVSSSYGNWSNNRGKLKRTNFLGWLFTFPVLTNIFGYFPANRVGMGEDMPYNVAMEWWKWNIGNLSHHKLMEKYNIPHFYHDVKLPMLAYIMSDDDLATEKVIPYFKADYKNADLKMRVIHPKDYDLEDIGHFGYFKAKSQPIWEETLKWLEN